MRNSISRNVAFALIAFSLCLGSTFARAEEITVTRSYAACKDPATVEKFEEFERRDDDQGYKQLFFSTGATRECIFLRQGEILNGSKTRGRWTCVRPGRTGDCYWTATTALTPRR